MMEVKARGGKILLFTDELSAEVVVDESFIIPKVAFFLSPIIATIPLQLLAYYIAVQKGSDVDQPRNLAKAVTVE
jgi:glucosamine--fructose-6-phosphate aminotransferase (isomerizing)